MIDAPQLRCSPLFETLSDDELERWAAACEQTAFLDGANIAKEGEFAYRFYVVLEGEVEVLHGFDRVALLGIGDFFGEMGVMTASRRNARVTAHGRCTLASMVAWDFQELTGEFPEVARRIDEKVQQRMAALPDQAD
jgi:CRP/FNR family cyclic AMP-dependent transcriptional regulator